jgi:hypothetical protein
MQVAKMNRAKPSRWVGLAVAFIAAGCSINPVPQQEVASAEAAIAGATSAGAAQAAPADLQLARNKLTLARRWIRAQDPGPARWLAEQAQVDAEFARVMAISASARSIAEARRRVRLSTLNPGGSTP